MGSNIRYCPTFVLPKKESTGECINSARAFEPFAIRGMSTCTELQLSIFLVFLLDFVVIGC